MQLQKRAALAILAAVTAGSALAAGVGAASIAPQPTTATTIVGQGATFPLPLYQEWIEQYKADFSANTVTISYTGTGSGAGIKSVQDATRTSDFAGTDAAMSDAELAAATGNGGIQHIPTVVGPIVLAYNLPGLKTKSGAKATLRLTAANINDIYAGRITKWNDKLIAAANPTVKLPNLAITPVRRADASGTTFGFSSYLCAISKEWKTKFGGAPSKTWPATGVAGIASPRNSGVANKVFSTRGAIGYMELSYAISSGLPTAKIRNKAGAFVSPNAASTKAAVAAATYGADLRTAAIVQSPGFASYPIVSPTFVLVYKDYADANKAKAVVSFLSWALTEGQSYAVLQGYVPLPSNVVAKAIAALHSIKANGSVVWP